LTFNIIWISVLFIIWKDPNNIHFNNKTEQLSSLLKNVKLQAYWWLLCPFQFLVHDLKIE